MFKFQRQTAAIDNNNHHVAISVGYVKGYFRKPLFFASPKQSLWVSFIKIFKIVRDCVKELVA